MAEETWIEEYQKWRPELDLTIVPYSTLCERAPDSRGRLSEVTFQPRYEHRQQWDTVIADEAHYLKGRDTSWSRAFFALTKKLDRVYLLTGTPIPNWSFEIFMLLRILHPGDKRWTNFWDWVEKWFDTWKPHWGGTKVMRLQKRWTWDDFIVENGLDEDMLRRTRDMPEVVAEMGEKLPVSHQIIRVPMVPAQAKLYREFKRDYLAWVEGTGQEVSAWSDGELHSKLSQIATGIEILGGDSKGSGKMDAAVELMKGRAGNSTVLFCHYRRTADALVARMKKIGVDAHKVNQDVPQKRRDEIRRGFQAGTLECIVGSLGVITENWTLTRADTGIFVEHSWRPSRNLGAIKRLDRIGQTRPVTAIHLVTKDTVDERMLKILGKKNDQQIKMMRAHQFASML